MPHPYDNSENADVWTKIAAGSEAITGFISNAYWLATLFDIITGEKDDFAGVSFYAMGFGVICATLSASGAAYAHYILNKQHQHSHHSQQNEENGKNLQHGNLTPLQKAALVGDYVSHIGEVTGPLTFVANLAAKDKLPHWGKLAVQGGATVFGAIASVANVRTCKNNMQNANRDRELNDQEPSETSKLINSL